MMRGVKHLVGYHGYPGAQQPLKAASGPLMNAWTDLGDLLIWTLLNLGADSDLWGHGF